MKRYVLLASLSLLGGCITLFPDPPEPPRLYVLEAGQAEALAGAPLDATIGVSLPEGERALLGSDLLWRTRDELELVGHSQWSNRADAALQSMLVQTLVGQARFRAATRQGDAHADYELRWEVLDFEVVADTRIAHFVADVKLVALPSRRVVAQRVVRTHAELEGETSSGVAARALASAARKGSAEIGVFAADNAAQASAASINR